MVGPFEHDDPGHRADPSFPNLLEKATNVLELSPHCGTELQGVQIVRSSAPTKKKKTETSNVYKSSRSFQNRA